MLFSVFTSVRVCATAEESRICTTHVCMFTAPEVASVMVSVAAELLVTMLWREVTGTVAAFPEAVIAFAVVITWANVCVPVKVCAASVRATLALVPGKVIVVESVPARVILFETVSVFPAAIASTKASPPASVPLLEIVSVFPSVPANVVVALCVAVFPSAIVSVAEVAGAVIATLLMLVAVATPRTGVTRVGDVARTIVDPVPVVVAATIAVPFPANTGAFTVVESVSWGVAPPEEEPASPLAVATETAVTVPVVGVAYSTAVSPAFTRSTLRALPVRESAGASLVSKEIVPVLVIGPPVRPVPVSTSVTAATAEGETNTLCVTGSTYARVGVTPSALETPIKVGIVFPSLLAFDIIMLISSVEIQLRHQRI